MKRSALPLILGTLATLALISEGVADVSDCISYQGRLTGSDGTPVANGIFQIHLRIYDAPVGGAVVWDNGVRGVQVTDGLFTYLLGDSTAFGPSLFTANSQRWLGTKVGSDPELTPRTLVGSTAYSHRAKQANAADTAQWGLLKNMPAGFADGIDDGISQAAADDRYLNESGDWSFGPLYFETPFLPNARIGEGGIDVIRPGSTMNAIRLTATTSGGVEYIYDGTGAIAIGLSGYLTGDGSVTLPANAVNATELFNEPGIASNIGGSQIYLTTTMQDLAVVTITIPSAGYVLVMGRIGNAWLGGTTLENYVWAQIDETTGGTYQSNYYAEFGAYTHVTTVGVEHGSLFVERIYYKAAGSYTFRLEAMRYGEVSGWVGTRNCTVTAVYLPTAFGTVMSASENPTGADGERAEKITGPDGNSGTVYVSDLRELELKAAKADAEAERLRREVLEEKLRQQMPDK